MKTLGVTGGIGSGKTTVCERLKVRGAEVFYADLEAKQLQVEDADAKMAIIKAFGAGSYTPDGALNRAYLAGVVFGHPEKLRTLNAIVHPRVRQRLLVRMEEARRRNVPLFVYEAALVFESGGDALVDAVLVVDADLDVRIQRVQARDGATEAQVRARIQHQLADDERLRRADFIIRNNGDAAALDAQIETFWQQFVEGRPA